MPLTKMSGRKTATVVSVEAVTAFPTSLAPSRAAALTSFPFSLCLAMFSRTTIELSRSIPTPSAMPPSDMILSVRSAPYIILKVAMTETGIDIEMITVDQKLPRKK
jgi:hypothetical protein